MKHVSRSAWGSALALLLVIICGLCRPASANTVYVNKNAPGTFHDGKSWATAFTAIQPAIDAGKSGDDVWVAAGVYNESITLKGGVAVFGGFSGIEIFRTQRDWRNDFCILDGAGFRAGVSSTVNGADLDGFTVRNSKPAISVRLGTATISNCTIIGNSTIGIAIVGGSNVTVLNCTLNGNDTGMSVSGSTASLIRSSVSGNLYGIYSLGEISITNCRVCDNEVCGIFSGGKGALTNCTVAGNGTGVWATAGSTAAANCIIAANGTGAMRDAPSGIVLLSNCDVYGNIQANYSQVADSTGTRGNISADPQFVNRSIGDDHLREGSMCVDSADDTLVSPSDKDLDGLPRWYGAHVDMGAFEWQPPRALWSASLGGSMASAMAVFERAAYVATDNGRLYAYSTETGSAISGFPVDICAAVGATVKLPSRPAVYYGKTGKAIYLTTDRGDVLRVLPNGTVAWHVRPLMGQTVSTPAVTPDGNVYVNLSTGAGPFNNYVFKLDEATGTPLSLSPFLGYTTADNIGDFSPAANSKYLYVNSGWGSKSGLTLLNQNNLAVRSSFAGGEQCLSPLLLGSDLLLASKSGKVWKMNSVTLAPDLGFCHFGAADLGTPISAAPFSDAAGNVYIGTADGRILKWVPGTGAFTKFYTATGRVSGLTINRTAGVLGFGTSTGSFVQVPLDNPSSATTVTPGGPISTGSVYESLTDRFIVVTETGVLSGFPSIR